jgi:hypothetical protein
MGLPKISINSRKIPESVVHAPARCMAESPRRHFPGKFSGSSYDAGISI